MDGFILKFIFLWCLFSLIVIYLFSLIVIRLDNSTSVEVPNQTQSINLSDADSTDSGTVDNHRKNDFDIIFIPVSTNNGDIGLFPIVY